MHYRVRRRAGGGRPGERLPLDRARHRHRVRQVGHAGGRSGDHAARPTRRCSSAATRRSGPRTSSGPWRTATTRRSRSTSSASGEDVAERPPPGVTLVSQKMGIHEWSYDNDISNDLRYRVPLRDKAEALKQRQAGGRARLRPASSAIAEAQRCLNCDVETVFADAAVHRVRRLRRHLPDGLHHLHRQRRGGGAARAAERAGAEPDPGPLCVGDAADRAHHGQGRGRLPALRAVRRALPDRRLGHAEIPARHDPCAEERVPHADGDGSPPE